MRNARSLFDYCFFFPVMVYIFFSPLKQIKGRGSFFSILESMVYTTPKKKSFPARNDILFCYCGTAPDLRTQPPDTWRDLAPSRCYGRGKGGIQNDWSGSNDVIELSGAKREIPRNPERLGDGRGGERSISSIPFSLSLSLQLSSSLSSSFSFLPSAHRVVVVHNVALLPTLLVVN